MKNKRISKYIIVLVLAIIVRLLFAVVAPAETQQYISLVIIVLAIVAFFTWDYVDGKRRQKNED
ncbi:hypothetical protein ACFQ3N_01070 [Virgibacillus byunsanensis]|uniref:Uncharacterized protein n=1 Tax=Virgibacillus byunsanensis TaxID=570945 RepID=A0ABW3LHV9_9BACI